jgi:hypothetical protein
MPKDKVKLLTPPSSDASGDESDLVAKKVVPDSDSENDAASDSEISAEYGMEGGEDEMNESIGDENTPNNSEGEEDQEIDYNEQPRKADKYEKTEVNGIPTFYSRKPEKGEITVEFEYAEHSEAYYHTIKALCAPLIDGEEAEDLDLMGLADHICERVSIGTVVVSPLDPKNDPE